MMYFLDLLGTFAFAVTGAYKAKSRSNSLIGAVFFAIITAVGGGTVRDLIIGRTPLFYLKDLNYLIIASAAGLITYFSPTFFKRRFSFFRLVDSIGLAVFCVIGVSITKQYLFNGSAFNFFQLVPAVLMGMLTGFGGGIIRDSIMGDMPVSLKRGSNYATSAFWGSLVFYMLSLVDGRLGVIVSIGVTLTLREIISDFGIYKKVLRTR